MPSQFSGHRTDCKTLCLEEACMSVPATFCRCSASCLKPSWQLFPDLLLALLTVLIYLRALFGWWLYSQWWPRAFSAQCILLWWDYLLAVFVSLIFCVLLERRGCPFILCSQHPMSLHWHGCWRRSKPSVILQTLHIVSGLLYTVGKRNVQDPLFHPEFELEVGSIWK